MQEKHLYELLSELTRRIVQPEQGDVDKHPKAWHLQHFHVIVTK